MPTIAATDNTTGGAQVTATGGGGLTIQRAAFPAPGQAVNWSLSLGATSGVPQTVAGPGRWLWRSIDAAGVSDVLYRPIGDPGAELTALSTNAVRNAIIDLWLPGLPSGNIIRQWTEQTIVDKDTWPRCVVCPAPVADEVAPRDLTFVCPTISVLVCFGTLQAKDSPRTQGGEAVNMRDRALAWFRGSPVLDVPNVQLVTVAPDVAVMPEVLRSAGVFWSCLTVRIKYRMRIT